MFGARGESAEEVRRKVKQTRDDLLAAVERLDDIVRQLEAATEKETEEVGRADG